MRVLGRQPEPDPRGKEGLEKGAEIENGSASVSQHGDEERSDPRAASLGPAQGRMQQQPWGSAGGRLAEHRLHFVLLGQLFRITSGADDSAHRFFGHVLLALDSFQKMNPYFFDDFVPFARRDAAQGSSKTNAVLIDSLSDPIVGH